MSFELKKTSPISRWASDSRGDGSTTALINHGESKATLYDIAIRENNLLDLKPQRDFYMNCVEDEMHVLRKAANFVNCRDVTDAATMYQIGFKCRAEYIRSGSEIYLQLAHTAFCLALYEENCSDIKYPIRIGLYLDLSLNYRASFSNLLKKVRNVCMISTFASAETVEFRERREKILEDFKSLDVDLKAFDYTKCRNYDSLFNEQYLIHFREDTDDFREAFSFKESIPEALEVFRHSLKELLEKYENKELHNPYPHEEMTWLSDSVIYSNDDEKKVGRSLLRETPEKRGCLTKDFRFHRSVINVSPANVRDAYISNVDTLYSIKRIHYLVIQILDKIPFSAMTNSSSLSISRKKRISKFDSYIMLDFKKCGLTIPFSALKICKEELTKTYPQFGDVFECIDGYSNMVVKDGSVDRHPVRGTGLGNANSLCTLMQCVIAHFLSRDGWDAVLFNDDGVWRYPGASKRDAFDQLAGIFSDIGFEVNLKKSFLSESNVFCEEYLAPEGTNWEKRQLFFFPISSLFLQNGIPNAKRFLRNLIESLKGTSYSILTYSLAIEKFYGNEFADFETYLPLELGGWRDYSPTNFSSLIDVLVSPKYYLEGDLTGYAGLLRKFANFVLSSENGSLTDFFATRIAYDRKKDTGFLKPEHGYVTLIPAEKEIGMIYGISTNEDYVNLDIDLLNYRGLANAKRGIRFALDKKTIARRIRFFKLFWRLKNTISGNFSLSHATALIYIMRQVKPNLCFTVPRVYYQLTGWEVFERPIFKKRRAAIFGSKIGKYPIPRGAEQEGRTQIQNFLVEDRRIIPSTDIFYFRRSRRTGTDVAVRSTKPVIYLKASSKFEIPSEWYLYCKNGRALICELLTRNQQAFAPIQFFVKKTEDIITEKLENFPAVIFNVPNVWREIITQFSQKQRYILASAIAINGADKDAFLNYFKAAKEFVSTEIEKKEIHDRIYYESRGLFKDALFGEKDILDLLDDFADEEAQIEERKLADELANESDDNGSVGNPEEGETLSIPSQDPLEDEEFTSNELRSASPCDPG